MDLNLLRQEALRWQCEPGTACTGKAKDLDTPMRYSTSHCSEAEPLSDFLNSSESFTAVHNDKVKSNIVIKGKIIEVNYIGSSLGKTIQNNIRIVPEAMSWCD